MLQVFMSVGQVVFYQNSWSLQKSVLFSAKRVETIFTLFYCHFLSLQGPMLQNLFVCDLQIFILSQSVCQTRLEKLTADKHPTLLRKSII
jgi:hypothetical protein